MQEKSAPNKSMSLTHASIYDTTHRQLSIEYFSEVEHYSEKVEIFW